MDIDYVILNLHLDHRNIIKYCREDELTPSAPSVDEINWTLLANWNQRVDPAETVVFVGDFAWFYEETP